MNPFDVEGWDRNPDRLDPYHPGNADPRLEFWRENLKFIHIPGHPGVFLSRRLDGGIYAEVLRAGDLGNGRSRVFRVFDPPPPADEASRPEPVPAPAEVEVLQRRVNALAEDEADTASRIQRLETERDLWRDLYRARNRG